MMYRAFILALWVTTFAAWATGATVETQTSQYAVVNSISIHSNSAPGEFTLVITGEITDRCSQLKHVDVVYSPGLVEVFPIMQLTEFDNVRCGAYRAPFSYAQTINVEPGGAADVLVYRRNGEPLKARIEASEEF